MSHPQKTMELFKSQGKHFWERGHLARTMQASRLRSQRFTANVNSYKTIAACQSLTDMV